MRDVCASHVRGERVRAQERARMRDLRRPTAHAPVRGGDRVVLQGSTGRVLLASRR